MRNNRKALLASTIIAGLIAASPSQAQSQDNQDKKEEAESSATTVADVVVTGSRIRRNEFTSSQPVMVLTSEQAALEGLADTAEILQSSTAANTATQINNFFTGFVTTGGPGVNTISLRGLGAQRTLVLVNGRRAGPAGVRGTVGPTDLNTIPSSQIERVEILTDGASSIYGSDAVAGVINIITKTNQDGGNVEFYTNQPLDGGGEEFRVNGSYGKTFDRGYITVGADYYSRKELLFGDRDYFACPQDRAFLDENMLIRGDVVDPATGDYKCVGILNGILRATMAGGDASTRRDGDFIFNPNAAPGTGFTGCDIAGFQHVAGGVGACSITAQPTDVRRAAYAVYPQYSERNNTRTAISPVDRYSLSLFGGYDLTPNVEVFGELLFNRRESEQISFRQLFPTVSPFHSMNPFGGAFNGGTGAGHWAQPVAMVDSINRQEVDYYRAAGGFRGNVNMFNRNWDWELVGQYSRSEGVYGGNFFYKDRVEASAGYAAALGLDKNLQPLRDAAGKPTGARPFGAATGNCDVRILETATACPTGGVNYFSKNFIENGVLSPEELAFLYGYEEGNTLYEHAYVEGMLSGDLFTLPAGPVGAAVGFHIRNEKIDDTPGEQQRNNNLWGSTSAGRTVGEDSVKELFAELEIPVVRNVPLFNSLSVNLSGRFSDYDSYGQNSTYKAGLNWSVTPSFRVRASTGTSFRAPALFEQFLGAQTSFLAQSQVDPCINYQNSTNEILQANCKADGVPENYAAAGGSSALITRNGGAGFLEAETAESQSIGVIWTPAFADFSIALDYWKISVENEVSTFGSGNILASCYTSINYPKEPLCDLFVREKDPTSPRYNNIVSVNDDYRNISAQNNEGLDLNIRYRKEFSAGDLTLNGRASYILDWNSQTFADSDREPIEGQIGYPEFVGQVSARFDRGDWTGFWSADLVGETDNVPFLANPTNKGTFLGQPVWWERSTPFYMTHNISLRRKMDKTVLQLGVRNLFNENPPLVGSNSTANRIGNTPLASQYDWQGRSITFTISHSF